MSLERRVMGRAYLKGDNIAAVHNAPHDVSS